MDTSALPVLPASWLVSSPARLWALRWQLHGLWFMLFIMLFMLLFRTKTTRLTWLATRNRSWRHSWRTKRQNRHDHISTAHEQIFSEGRYQNADAHTVEDPTGGHHNAKLSLTSS